MKAALIFLVLLLVAVGLLIYPMSVIQPFRHQGEAELRAALWIFRWRVYFEAVAVIAAVATLLWTWRNQIRLWPRVLACIATLSICGAAGLTRVNVFEIMFHRYDQPAFSPVSEAKVDPDDKVLAIRINGHARAYPIRNIAYHHIINDEVGGLPVVATY